MSRGLETEHVMEVMQHTTILSREEVAELTLQLAACTERH